MNKINIGILGATGYTGAELVRILSRHQYVNISYLASDSNAYKKFSGVYPNFLGICDIECEKLDVETAKQKCDVVFTALPHGISKEIVPALFNSGLKVIDLSGDFRYDNADTYEKWYGEAHPCVDVLAKAVYGLPELHKDKIKVASLVGNPGCYTTTSILSLVPLLKNGIIDDQNIIIDAKSGVSGAGKSLSLGSMFCECSESLKAYKIATHRHTSEIEQELSKVAKTDILVSFTPHLIPIKRGILATCYANLKKEISVDEIIKMFNVFYKDQPFVRIYDNGQLPEIKNVVNTNYIDIGISVDKRLNRVIIVGCIDNMIKGASGQAVQNMNLMFGFDESEGLKMIGGCV